MSALKKKKRKPDAAAGKFAIAFGGFALILAIFVANVLGQKLRLAAPGLMLLGWGMGQVSLAKKWQGSKDAKKEDEQDATSVACQPDSDNLEKLEKSGSMQNVFVLLGWVLLSVTVVSIVCCGYLFLFHRKQ